MALQPTNLVIQAGQLPPTFNGTPQELLAAMVRRMKILSPNGTNFIFIGDTEPTSNVGPWLKNGTKWYVFDETIKRYVPLDISDSETRWYHIGNSTPTTSEPPLWLKTTANPTEDSPSVGKPIGWYEFNGTAWEPFVGIVLSGPTADRPTSPATYQLYYDTDIAVLIWFERGQWRTVSGVPGDAKPVYLETAEEALTRNPGWQIFGIENQNLRGRWIMQAAKDPGVSPETDLSVPAGVAKRAAFETFGETDGVKIDGASPVPYPPSVALWWLVKT